MTHRFIPRLSPEEIARQQLEGLRFTVRQAFKSPQYRKRLEACGVTPDDITSLDDLRRRPTRGHRAARDRTQGRVSPSGGPLRLPTTCGGPRVAGSSCR